MTQKILERSDQMSEMSSVARIIERIDIFLTCIQSKHQNMPQLELISGMKEDLSAMYKSRIELLIEYGIMQDFCRINRRVLMMYRSEQVLRDMHDGVSIDQVDDTSESDDDSVSEDENIVHVCNCIVTRRSTETSSQ